MVSQNPKVVIVTGASRGIGLAVAEYLLNQKHNVVVVARSKAPLESIESKYPEQTAVLAGDFSDFSVGPKAVELAIRTFGRLDGLVVNHAILAPVTRIADASAEDWRKAFDVNIFSAVELVKSAIPELRKSEGKIVMVSSGASVKGYSTWGAYGGVKAALNHLALTLSVEEPKITSLAIRPGTVDTEMQRELREVHNTVMDEKDAKEFADIKATGRLLRPDQPGNVIARLSLSASPDLAGKFLSWNDEALAEYQD